MSYKNKNPSVSEADSFNYILFKACHPTHIYNKNLKGISWIITWFEGLYQFVDLELGNNIRVVLQCLYTVNFSWHDIRDVYPDLGFYITQIQTDIAELLPENCIDHPGQKEPKADSFRLLFEQIASLIP